MEAAFPDAREKLSDGISSGHRGFHVKLPSIDVFIIGYIGKAGLIICSISSSVSIDDASLVCAAHGAKGSKEQNARNRYKNRNLIHQIIAKLLQEANAGACLVLP